MTEKNYEVSTISGVTLITLGPKLASAYESVLAELGEIPELAASIDPPQMMVDLGVIEYCGSAFVGFLFKLAGILNHRDGGEFAVCCPNNFTKMVFKTTKSEVVFSIFDSVDDGIARLSE
jgi:anti-anti-sigma regulatory factor